MEYKDIVNLLKLINKSNLSEFKMKDGEFELSIRTDKYSKVSGKSSPAIVQVPQQPVQPTPPAQTASQPSPQEPAAAPSEPKSADTGSSEKQAPDEDSSNLVEVKSPIVGTFYRSPSPDKPPYVKVGDTIDVGSVVCIVEAMKLFNEIESEVSGKVVKVMTEDASPVEYDQVLFLVDPNG